MHGRSQPHERAHVTSYSKTEEMELIAKIVRDLRDIKIGDSRYVLPPPLLALEKQVIERGYTRALNKKFSPRRSDSVLIRRDGYTVV